MGISGLLQFIKDAAEPINVKKYKGQTVAVDTYCWLHKGAFSCAEKLAKGEPTEQYVWYCMKLVDMLLTFSVKPILVFDGRNLPSKQEVEKARRERREANFQKGRQLLREGKLAQARDCFTRCVNITSAMAHKLIKAARARGVDCVVAPYEADAQLAFLTKFDLAQAVITEDSDLLAFGCKKVILKMDKQGNGLEVDQRNLGRCRSLGNVFTQEKFRYMCILSGCDYLPSLHGIGLGKACKLLRLAKDPDILKVIRKMGQYLKMNLVVPEMYMEGFIRANNTFLYQLVFDPIQRKVVPLNPYPEHMDPATLGYAGINVGDDKGLQMALGNLDVNSMKRIDDFSPDKPAAQSYKSRTKSWNDSPAFTGPSIWSRGFTPASATPPQAEASPDRPPSTRGRERVVSAEALRLPCKQLIVKWPREDSSISDVDVLQQYSVSSQKRCRSDSAPVDCSSRGSQLPPRNRFATLLQRRNQELEEEHQTTRSRFFCSSSSPTVCSQSTSNESPQALDPPAKDEDTQSESLSVSQPNDSGGPESIATPSPPSSPGVTSSGAASQGLRLFQWSTGSSSETLQTGLGLAALKQFHYRKESCWSPPPQPPSHYTESQAKEESPPSPPSQDSAYFSQSRPHLTDSQHSTDSSPELLGPTHRTTGSLTSKVSGLSKPRSSCQAPVAKVQKLGQARASGLRRRPEGALKRLLPPNNENSPAVQSTISGLWKNFSFQRDPPKMTSCKKGGPMSPVEDNMAAS